MSLARPTHQSVRPDHSNVLKALARLLARQVARESVTSNPKEKEAHHDEEEGTEDAPQAGEARPAG